MVATQRMQLAVNRRPQPADAQTSQPLTLQSAVAIADKPQAEPAPIISVLSFNVPVASFAQEQGRTKDNEAFRLVHQLESMGILDSAQLLARLAGASRRSLALRMIAHKDETLSESLVRVLIRRWLSQADLMRSGLSLESARLLVAQGTETVQALAGFTEPSTRKRLYVELAVLANRTGDRLPTMVQLNHSIDRARGLTPFLGA